MKIQLKLITLLAALCLSSYAFSETVYCTDKEVGSEFQHNGYTYLVVDNDTARGEETLQKLINGTIRYCTSHMTNMSYLFYGEDPPLEGVIYDRVSFELPIYSFNQSVNDWNISNITDISGLFESADSFNQPLDEWDVSNVTNMSNMFLAARSFNQPLNNWNVSNVTNMTSMFSGAITFNQPLNSWDVSKVTYMDDMFAKASTFNQPLNNWNISNVKHMNDMFLSPSIFNHSLDSWAKKPQLPNQ